MTGQLEPLIRANRLSKHYQFGGETVKALDEVTLAVYPGELIAITGPSGSGKSTLMNLIGCLDIPTSGEYHLDGQNIAEVDDNQLAEIRNKKIGFIFQNFNLLPRLTAFENVELPLIYRGFHADKRKQIAEQCLENVGLLNWANHRPPELSGGQQQRVAIARALSGNPSILLADEPTGALDSKTGKEVLQLIHALNEKGHTILLITHDLTVASQAKRTVQIKDGKIINDEGEVI